MRLSEKYKNWHQSRNFSDIFGKKKLLIFLIIITTLIIIGSIIWFFIIIYTQDKPLFVPKETRGEIREVIKENITEPIAEIFPSIGQSIVDSKFVENSDITSNQETEQSDPTANWKTYKNEDLDIELKYPEEYRVEQSNESINIFHSDYLNVQSEYPGISMRLFNESSENLNNWINLNSNMFIGDQNPEEVDGFLFRNNFYFKNKIGIYFDWISLGETRDYVFNFKNKIVNVNIVGVNNELNEIAKNIIISIK